MTGTGQTGLNADCARYRAPREYTHVQELADNLPYLLMGLVGSAILLAGLGTSAWGWIAAGVYLGYCVVGALWIILFVCPSCQYHGTRACPCGYGQIAARLRPRDPRRRFASQFRKHIPVIVPLWLVPALAGVIFLIRDYDEWMLALLLAFVIDAYVLLPLVSRLYGCGHCPQSHDCPWMFKRTGKVPGLEAGP